MKLIDNAADPLCQEQINVLWALMRRDFADYIVPVRDKDRWLYRYVSHPEITYKLAIVSNALSNRPLAAFVMVEHPDFIELVDYVGGVEGVELAVLGARHFAHVLGQSSLKGWFSNAIVFLFNAHC